MNNLLEYKKQTYDSGIFCYEVYDKDGQFLGTIYANMSCNCTFSVAKYKSYDFTVKVLKELYTKMENVNLDCEQYKYLDALKPTVCTKS